MTSSEAHPPEDKPTGRAAPAATWEEALYTLLSTAPSLATAASRRMVSVFLPPALRPLAPAATLPRDEFVAALVALCAERPENTETLVAVMQSLDGDAQHIRQLRMLCDQRLAQTRFPEADFDLLRTLVEAVPVEEVQEIAASSMDLLPAPFPSTAPTHGASFCTYCAAMCQCMGCRLSCPFWSILQLLPPRTGESRSGRGMTSLLKEAAASRRWRNVVLRLSHQRSGLLRTTNDG